MSDIARFFPRPGRFIQNRLWMIEIAFGCPSG
jgi:hypothetical protein